MELEEAIALLQRVRYECVDHELSGLVGDILDVYQETNPDLFSDDQDGLPP